MALGYLQKALSLTKQRSDEISLHLKLAEVLELLGRWEEAESHCQAVLTLVEQDAEHIDHKAIAYSSHSLGQLLSLRGEYPTALKWLEKARGNGIGLGIKPDWQTP